MAVNGRCLLQPGSECVFSRLRVSCADALHGDEPIASLESARAGLFATGKAISNSRRWLIIALLFTASFINYVDRGTISVALPLIAQDLHFGPELKGVLLSAFF